MNKRNTVLDFLRFLAIIVVVLSHCPITKSSPFIIHLLEPGYLGVELFFVLSGFLIGGLIVSEYEKTGNFDTKLFLIRRGFKIYPSYYIFLIASSVYQFFIHRFTIQAFLSDFFFLSNYTSYSGRVWFWSLSIEEHFYILLCILSFYLIKFKKFNFNNIVIVYFIILSISMFFRIFNLFYFENSSWKRDFQLTHSRLDSLFFGTVTFFIYHKKNKVYQFIINNKNWLFCIAFLVVILNYVFLRDIRLLNIVLLSFNSIAFGTLLIILLNSNKFAEYNLIKRVSVIGKYSYGIYLLHPFIGVVLPYIKKYAGTGLLLMVIYVTIAITTGIVYSKLIEYPFLKLRDKYFPSKAKSII